MLTVKNVQRKKPLPKKSKVEKKVLVCSFCGKAKSGSGKWNKSLLKLSSMNPVSMKHDICPECDQKFFKNGKDAFV